MEAAEFNACRLLVIASTYPIPSADTPRIALMTVIATLAPNLDSSHQTAADRKSKHHTEQNSNAPIIPLVT